MSGLGSKCSLLLCKPDKTTELKTVADSGAFLSCHPDFSSSLLQEFQPFQAGKPLQLLSNKKLAKQRGTSVRRVLSFSPLTQSSHLISHLLWGRASHLPLSSRAGMWGWQLICHDQSTVRESVEFLFCCCFRYNVSPHTVSKPKWAQVTTAIAFVSQRLEEQ